MIDLFKQKPKPLVLNFYTDMKEVFDFAKPVKAAKTIPDWWKELPKDLVKDPVVPESTMKRCVGFTELFQHGFVLPLWSDFNIDIAPVGASGARWAFSDRRFSAGIHPPEQRGSFLPEEHYQHVKLTCPWYAHCDEEVNWMMTTPMWNLEAPDKVIIPPAVVDFTHQGSMNVNMFFVRDANPYIHKFAQGQALLHVVPLTERPVEYRYHLVSREELDKYRTVHLWFTNKYANAKSRAQKCPVNHGRG